MLFIHPMWSHESERIGKQKCTPTGYALHVAADLLGFIGLLCLLGVLAWFVFVFKGTGGMLWLIAIPLGIGVVSEFLFQISWWLARRRGFEYDAKLCESSWKEGAQRRTYRYKRR